MSEFVVIPHYRSNHSFRFENKQYGRCTDEGLYYLRANVVNGFGTAYRHVKNERWAYGVVVNKNLEEIVCAHALIDPYENGFFRANHMRFVVNSSGRIVHYFTVTGVFGEPEKIPDENCYCFYDANGTQFHYTPENPLLSADNFNECGQSVGKKEDGFYLLLSDGRQIGKNMNFTYMKINAGGLVDIENRHGKGILDADGNTLLECQDMFMDVRAVNEQHVFIDGKIRDIAELAYYNDLVKNEKEKKRFRIESKRGLYALYKDGDAITKFKYLYIDIETFEAKRKDGVVVHLDDMGEESIDIGGTFATVSPEKFSVKKKAFSKKYALCRDGVAITGYDFTYIDPKTRQAKLDDKWGTTVFLNEWGIPISPDAISRPQQGNGGMAARGAVPSFVRTGDRPPSDFKTLPCDKRVIDSDDILN